MNGNKLFFYLFSLVLLINGFFGLEIKGNYFLSSIIGNPIWREIILGGVVYYFGYKYIKEIEQSKENTKLQNFTNTLSNLFLLCLGLLAFQSIFGQNIFGFDLANYKLGAVILNLIQNLQYALVILAIVFGSLIFYVNRDKIDSLEEKKKQEEMEEEKRKKEFEEKFPRLNKIPVIGGVVRWFYVDKWYAVGVILIIILGLILKYHLANNLSPENDETYTYMVIEGFNKFGKIGITPSGEMYYYDHKLFHYLTTVFYNFFYEHGFSKLFSLRAFNIFLGSLLFIPFYSLLKKIFTKKLALLSLILISINWYLAITFITARPYVLFSIGSVIISLLFLLGLKKLQDKKKLTFYILIGLTLSIIIFYEGHILGLYHHIVFIGILIAYLVTQLGLKKGIKIIFSFLALITAFGLYLYFLKNNFFIFILKTFNPYWQYNYLSIWFNQFSYITIIGLIIILLLLIYGLFFSKNKNIKLFSFYIILSAILIHGYLFGHRLNSFKYLSDFLIISIILFSFFILTYKNKKVIYSLLLIFFLTNVFGLYEVYKDKITWIVLYNENNIDKYMRCKNYNIIATDSPGRAYLLFGNKKKIYSLPSFNDSYHFNNIKYKYLNIYAIRDIKHLKNIINNQGGICFVFTHNMFNSTGKFGNEKLFKYIIENGRIIFKNYLKKRPFGTGKYPFSNNNNGIVLVINKSMIKNK